MLPDDLVEFIKEYRRANNNSALTRRHLNKSSLFRRSSPDLNPQEDILLDLSLKHKKYKLLSNAITNKFVSFEF